MKSTDSIYWAQIMNIFLWLLNKQDIYWYISDPGNNNNKIYIFLFRYTFFSIFVLVWKSLRYFDTKFSTQMDMLFFNGIRCPSLFVFHLDSHVC